MLTVTLRGMREAAHASQEGPRAESGRMREAAVPWFGGSSRAGRMASADAPRQGKLVGGTRGKHRAVRGSEGAALDVTGEEAGPHIKWKALGWLTRGRCSSSLCHQWRRVPETKAF